MTERRITEDQLPLGKAVALHLLPGVALVTLMYLLAPLMEPIGAPKFLAFLIAGFVVIGGWELMYLVRRGRERGVRLMDAVSYRERIPKSNYLLVIPLIAWMLFCSIAWESTGADATKEFFSNWVPSWALDPVPDDLSVYAPWALILTAVLTFVLNGVFGPFVEELYFRGHLMARMDRLGWVAPVLNVVLFSCYHLWTPWSTPYRILGFIPIAYVVWRKRNIWIGVTTHILLNMTTVATLVNQFLKGV